ncbi:MAG TPA: VOC family protein [Aestuariivirga sp.]|jgi:hypothetical protein|nr:VOC family protein [Aestuariivirga sp.]
MMTTPARIWWHELNTWEPESALSFYARALGWQFEAQPLPDGASYWIARKDGRAVGGIFALSDPDHAGVPSHWMTYMSVADIDEAVAEAAAAGGEITRPAVTVPGVGRLAMVTDSTGALIGLMEPADDHATAMVRH